MESLNKSEENPPFWKFNPEYWYAKLQSSPSGLQDNNIPAIQKKSGIRRRVKTRIISDLILLAGQFKSSISLLLIGAVLLASFLGETSDALIILFIVLSAGLLGFFQERHSNRVVEKLQSMISLRSLVIRDGRTTEIFSEHILPGDILMLKAGDMIPADSLIIESNELHANESGLTGESYPVRKFSGPVGEDTPLGQRTNCLWEGTSIVSGNARAIAIYTGENTCFGKIASGANATTETSFEKGVRSFGNFLMKITLVLALMSLMMNLLKDKGLVSSALFALALAVGMAPELLPAISTIAMSAGAGRLLKKKVIVKKLASIQNLGEVNLLCTDKTGTITEGSIRIEGLSDINGNESEFVKQLAYQNAVFESGYANPIDDAIKKMDCDIPTGMKKISEIPYDFIRKRLSIVVENGQEKTLITKGAFNQILSICSQVKTANSLPEDISSHISSLKKRHEEYGKTGLRAISICYKKTESTQITIQDETGMIFAGFILIKDPVKDDIRQTIEELNKLNVDLKIITGDNTNIAMTIAREIGIKEPRVISGGELSKTSSEALAELVKNIHIFAEVEPQQKERIILALRKKNVVAYLGDGINDVSAINAADVGISVSNATDVAREAADFVLLEKDLMVLTEGIREGRKTFANTMKYLYISTGSTFGNMCSVAVASFFLPFLPMLPKQILLTNFLTDFPFLTISSDKVDEEQLKKPGIWNLDVIRRYMLIFGMHSTLFDLITFMTLYFLLKSNPPAFQSGWFVESVLSELFILFIIRTHKRFFKSTPGRWMLMLGFAVFFMTITLPYLPFAKNLGLVPLPPLNLIAMLGIVMVYILSADYLKVWFFKKYGNR